MGVLLYEINSGTKMKLLTIPNHRAAFYGMCWSFDGKYLASGTLNPAAVAWDVGTGKVIRAFNTKKGGVFSRSTTMSTDDKWLVAASGGLIHIWDFATGNLHKSISVESRFVNTVVVSPDKKRLVVGAQDGFIRIIDIESGKAIRNINGGLWIGRTITVTSDFSKVALGAVHPTIKQWSLDTGERRLPEVTEIGHNAEVECVSFGPKGKFVVSGGPNHCIVIWDADSGKQIRKLKSKSSASTIRFVPGKSQFVTSWRNSGLLRVWDIESGRQLKTIDGKAKKVRSFAVSDDGGTLVAVVSDSRYASHSAAGTETVKVWDMQSGKLRFSHSITTASCLRVELGKDLSWVAIGTANGLVQVRDIETGKLTALLAGHHHQISTMCKTSDGRFLATGSLDQTIRVWDTSSWKLKHHIKGHARALSAMAFSPDGKYLVSGSGKRNYPIEAEHSNRIRVWRIEDGKQAGFFAGHHGNVGALAFSPGGDRIVSGHADTTLLAWDFKAHLHPGSGQQAKHEEAK